MRVEELSQGLQDVVTDIKSQMQGDVLTIFEMLLDKLGKPGAEDQKKLDLLEALIEAGVEDWNGYDNATSYLEEEE